MKNIDIKKDPFLVWFFIFMGILLISLFACLVALKFVQDFEIKSADNRYRSYVLANELRQSSDDLTNMVRLYVVTGNPIYRAHYNEILAIRDGKSPRPARSDEIYWDLVLEGDQRPRPFVGKESLKDLMLKQGFTTKEFGYLQEAHNNSDALVKAEDIAMDLIAGKGRDKEGNIIPIDQARPIAEKLVFGPEYMQAKADIMAPIQKFFESVDTRTALENQRLNKLVIWILTIAIVLSAATIAMMIVCVVQALKAISHATKARDFLLLNIVPKTIAERLKKGEENIAEEFQASVLFADMIGFSELRERLGTKEALEILNRLFTEFDKLTDTYQVEKIKTIGDNYMVVAGLPDIAPDHAFRLAEFALALQQKLKDFNVANNLHLSMRIGMTFGTVAAGVIGEKKFIYDLWGDVVKVASEMETLGVVGEIQVTDKMALALEERFIVQPRPEEIEVKGREKIKTFFLKYKKPTVAS